MTKEIETLKAKILKLPTMSMKLFDNLLENIDEDYPFSLSPKTHSGLINNYWYMCYCHRELFSYGIKGNFSHILHHGKLNKISSFLK